MAEQRQRFSFRLPWSSAPAAPRPRQGNQASSSPAGPAQPAAPPQQRRPFRLPGLAGSASPSTGQSPARAEPSLVSSSSTRSGRPSQVTSRSSPQHQIGTPPRSPVTSLSRDVPQTQSPSPSRGVSQQTKSIAPVTKPRTAPRSPALELEQDVESLSTPMQQPTATEITKPQKDKREEETFLPSSQKPLFMDTKKSRTEKVVETLKEKEELLASKETKLKQSQVSVLKSESKPESRNEVSVKEPMEILKGMDHEELEKKLVTHEKAQGSNTEKEGGPVKVMDEPGQHPREEIFDQKEILKTSGGNKHDPQSEHFGHEKGSRYNHNHTSTGEKAPLNKEIKEDSVSIMHSLGTKRDKHALNEKPFSIVTLTGENTGATMNLSSVSVKRERPIHIHRGYKAKKDESSDRIIDSEGSSRGRKHTNTKTEERRKKLYLNNNAQGVNNSLVFNSSVTERNPGAHVVFVHKEAVKCVKTGKEEEKHDTHKAEVSAIPAERLTYAPNIRRRCLKGLFLESSDSDPENLQKPRRHGCRAGCS